ncbi:MAG: ATP-binding cassette domain-containing protein [Lachnospiraceae bacterium]|nr:ATP-binding cassette domain-containing protein [Lachnospiraceae bacterium]
MSDNNEKKLLLSLKDVDVKFNVRGRTLQAIRNVSLDIYENESLAIVGESGSGKSVLTKTFAGMLDSNGYVSHGTIILSDDELSKTDAKLEGFNETLYNKALKMLNDNSVYERGAEEYRRIVEAQNEIKYAGDLDPEEIDEYNRKVKEKEDDIIDARNYLWTLDKKIAADVPEIAKTTQRISQYQNELKKIEAEHAALQKKRKAEVAANVSVINSKKEEITKLKTTREQKLAKADKEGNVNGLSDKTIERNITIAREIILSIGRYPTKDKFIFMFKLAHAFKKAMMIGEDLDDPQVRNRIFETCAFRVEFRSYDEATKTLHGYAILDCAKVKYTKDWQQIRGRRIATVFQDPMTSLNPVITIGKQITTVIMKHQKCTQAEAKERTIDIMRKVGIPEPEKRFDDYPFEYSGGMRQRIVIAIALSCQPKILICDEPTTALDVTIQAQIIRLIKDLQKELGFTTVYITHDLGVVANVAERVAVIYGGQIVEVGTVEEIFYDPKHPYTWALLSSLPQLAERGTDLFSIPGTPPSLYNKIVGDAFAPRNKYAMAIDLVKEPPVFKVSETHYAKTWLLDPRAPKTEMPENIKNLHEKMLASYIDFNEEAASNG